MVSRDPKIWVVDDFLPLEFLQMVNSTFDSAQTKCQVVKKPNGREILARNIDFDATDELCQAVFQRISELCGISATCGFTEFMVSEVRASGQDAHVDHVNVDDVGSSKLSFLDLKQQSCSEAEPRRVVPTISIIVYFNPVGGIRFPSASGVKTIAAKAGRMVMFHNYDDESRPSHKASAEHYGIYFETVPRRVLIMGVLANHTPDPTQSSTSCTPALVYCAGTRRDPLYHDNPSYDGYKTPQQISERIQADRAEEERIRSLSQPRGTGKSDLVLTLQLVFQDNGLCAVEGRNMAGDLMCKMNVSQQMMLRDLRGHVQRDADPNSVHNIVLCLPNGQLLTEEHDMSVLYSWSAAAGFDETGMAGTNSKLCCSSCSVS